MNEHLLGGGEGYLPAIYIDVLHVVLAVQAEAFNEPKTRTRKHQIFTAERVRFSLDEWREHFGDIHLTIHNRGVQTFSTWIDMREAKALESIRHRKGEDETVIPKDDFFWGSRIVKVHGKLNRVRKTGTPLYLQRRSG